MADVLRVLYAEKTDDYFAHARTEIIPLLPAGCAERVLEVGCGTGDTLAYLQQLGRCAWTCGVELFPDAGNAARERLDQVHIGNIEHIDLPIEPGSLDVILCLDVFEHLIDPWSTANRLAALLRPGGSLIASIPNVQHFRVAIPLLFGGKWEYADFGLMDRTHLRFFTERSARALLSGAGLRVDAVHRTGMESRLKSVVSSITFHAVDPLLTFQYLLRAVHDNSREE